jgi:ABC-type transport system involved in cytochrome c biogenesis ATPase subunit
VSPADTRTDGAAPDQAGGRAPALRLEGLRKRFGETTAVDHLDLTVPPGSFFGLVGPDGAGKTTSLSMAVGLLRPDGGSARIFGVDVWADPVAAKRLIGVLPDGMALPERLTGRELLSYLGLLRGLDEATVARRAQELLEVLELAEAEPTMVVDYSAGMRKKITLATALLHTPRSAARTPWTTPSCGWSAPASTRPRACRGWRPDQRSGRHDQGHHQRADRHATVAGAQRAGRVRDGGWPPACSAPPSWGSRR